MSWVAWAPSNRAFLDVLDHLGTFSVLIAVIFYFAESGDRLKQKHYQAWQVINTAQGRGGSGGRIEALQELNADHVSLIGIDASAAFLQGISLTGADLSRCDLHASDLRDGKFADASFNFCLLDDANFRHANLSGARLNDANMSDTDLNGADLRGADIAGADLSNADLRGADLEGVRWKDVRSLHLANIADVRNAPPEFVTFAMANGAVSIESDEEWRVLIAAATPASKSDDTRHQDTK